MSNDFWDKMNEEASKIKPLVKDYWGNNIPQHILYLKMMLGSDRCEPTKEANNLEKKHYSEAWVNLAMTYAYNKGCTDIDERSYNTGWEHCRKAMLVHLGVDVED